jgi:acyl dehydratase
MGFSVDALGSWTRDYDFEVDLEAAVTYGRATNDRNERYVNGELIPPMMSVLAIRHPLLELLHAVVSEDVIASLRGTHGEQDIVFHRHIVPGSVVRSRALGLALRPKRSGTVFMFKSETRSDSDVLLNEQYWTIFYRGVTSEVAAGDPVPDHVLPEGVAETRPIATVDTAIDTDQTFRYAAASGDHTPIHLSDHTARSVGLPGIIVHGLCTLAMVSSGMVDRLAGADPARLDRLAARFSDIVFPGERLTTAVWPSPVGAAGQQYAFQTSAPDGRIVLTNGLIATSDAARLDTR